MITTYRLRAGRVSLEPWGTTSCYESGPGTRASDPTGTRTLRDVRFPATYLFPYEWWDPVHCASGRYH